MGKQSTDEKYMHRALELALNGEGYVSPNPMVGAVIVAPDGRIIGEGWHRKFGESHAEVNAVNSVREIDRPLLKVSTMYVTLEPCSHYGKTPPCCDMIVRSGIPRVVIGSVDPFEAVDGRGIDRMTKAGLEVVIGVLGDECKELNRKFFTAHTLHRPYITLKWARSADGFMDTLRTKRHPKPYRFSNDLTTLTTMRLRSINDAIVTTSATINADNSRLTVRHWDGRQPKIVVLDYHDKINADSTILYMPEKEAIIGNTRPLIFGSKTTSDLEKIFSELYTEYGISSVLMECGPTLLRQILEKNLWDEAREEVSDAVLGEDGRHIAPTINPIYQVKTEIISGNRLIYYRRK